MGIFSASPEDLARRERERGLVAKREAAERFAASPAGKARSARQAGRRMFQIDLAVSATRGEVVPMMSAYATSTPAADSSGLIEQIEAEGWRLEHVGYVYRVTGSTSRDKFLGSGQQEAMHGEIVGIYLFRATEGPGPHAAASEAEDGGRTLLDGRL
jgi:hypothetical protein